MPMQVNKVILLGKLAQDAELAYTPSGSPRAKLIITTHQKTPAGNIPEYHNCIAWSRSAEILGDTAKKGMLLYVEGELRSRKFTDKNGLVRETIEVIISKFYFIDEPRP